MAIAFGTAGTVSSTGTTSLSVAYPASIASGDLLVCCITNKIPTNGPSTPAGWTKIQGLGGSGAAGSNTGDTYATAFWKVADGSESGSLSITITGGTAAGGRMFRYTGSGSYTIASVAGDAEFGWTVNTVTEVDPANPLANLALTANDMVVVIYASNSARIDLVSTALTMSGIVFGTRNDRTTANSDKFTVGNNVSLYVNDGLVTSGTANTTPTVKITNTSQGADDPSGGVILLRIRENAGGSQALAGTIAGAGACTGNMVVTYALAGTAPGVGTPTGNMVATYAIAGTIAGAGACTGDATITRLLAGAIAGAGAATGNMVATYVLAGTVAGQGNTTANPLLTLGLVGTVAGQGNTTGNMTATYALAGTVAGAGACTGDLSLGGALVALAGTIAAVGTPTGALALALALAGSCAGAGATTAAATITRGLAGTIAGQGNAAGALSIKLALSGTVVGTGTPAGNLGVLFGLSGIIAGAGAATGNLTVLLPFDFADILERTGPIVLQVFNAGVIVLEAPTADDIVLRSELMTTTGGPVPQVKETN